MDASWLAMPGALPSAVPVATIIGAWLLTYTLHSTVLLLTAWWLASRRRFSSSPAARHAIWKVALVAGWLTSAAQLASPWRPVGGAWQLPESARRAMAALQVTQRDDSPSSAFVSRIGAPITERSEVRHVRIRGISAQPGTPGTVVTTARELHAVATAPPSLATLRDGADLKLRLTVIALSRTTIAVLVWGTLAFALLLRLAYSRHRLLASLRARRDASRTVAGDALRHLTARAGTAHAVRLTMSDALPAPAAISHDEIVVPTRALRELTIAEQEGVLAHELAHVVRGDPRWLRVATWIECIGWFQPLNRIARRQLQLSAEFAADAWAVRLTREPLRLAQALARVAEWLTPRAASPAWHMPGADGSPLVERVRRLTGPVHDEAPRTRRGAHAAMAIAAASALALLPHVDASPLFASSPRRLERFEIRLADSAPSALLARRARTPLKPGVRLLRLNDAGIRISDGSTFEGIDFGARDVESRLRDAANPGASLRKASPADHRLRDAANVKVDTGLVPGGARRMLIVTARTTS